MKKIFIVCFVLFVLTVPFFASAQTIRIPCDGVTVPCDFYKIMELITNVLNFLVLISIPLAAIAFAWAGWLMVTAAGSEGKIEQAKEIFTKVLIGFIFVLAAWLIVRAITSTLLDDNGYNDLLRGTSQIEQQEVGILS